MAEISQAISNVISPDIRATIRSVNIDTTIVSTDFTLEVDASGGNRIITLPTAASQFAAGNSTGRIFNIKKIDSTSNSVTITPQGADTIDGLTSLIINAQYVGYTIQSDGTNYRRL